jgi:anti-anti-sigma regulatory factor
MATHAAASSGSKSSPRSADSAARPAAGMVGTPEYHTAPLSPTQEAAVLFSADHANACQQLLKEQLKDPVGKNNKQAWLMLFDLYQTAQNRAEFDSLSMLFTVRFEQSPPMWNEASDAGADVRRNQSRENKDFFALKPGPMGELAGTIEKFLDFTEDMGSVRVDFGKIPAITAEESAMLAAALVRLRKKKTPMWFNGTASLEKVLRIAFNEANEAARSYWVLLFELLILEGRNESFEELGLEYAVAFEISPPIWEVYVNTVSAAAAKASAPMSSGAKAAAAAEELLSGFSLKGVISSASQAQFAELTNYAASHAEVVVDMSKVLRIEFSSAAIFYDVVKAIQLAGKRVILANLNELNAALIEAFGFNRHAILLRKKSI